MAWNRHDYLDAFTRRIAATAMNKEPLKAAIGRRSYSLARVSALLDCGASGDVDLSSHGSKAVRAC